MSSGNLITLASGSPLSQPTGLFLTVNGDVVITDQVYGFVLFSGTKWLCVNRTVCKTGCKSRVSVQHH